MGRKDPFVDWSACPSRRGTAGFADRHNETWLARVFRFLAVSARRRTAYPWPRSGSNIVRNASERDASHVSTHAGRIDYARPTTGVLAAGAHGLADAVVLPAIRGHGGPRAYRGHRVDYPRGAVPADLWRSGRPARGDS